MALLRLMVLRDSAAVKYKTGSQAWALYQQSLKLLHPQKGWMEQIHFISAVCVCDYIKRKDRTMHFARFYRECILSFKY